MTPQTQAGWAAHIEACAHGLLPPGPARDDSAWDTFYRDYAQADTPQRALIDAAFAGFSASDDPLLIEALLLHAFGLPAQAGLPLLLHLLDTRAEFLRKQARPQRSEPLLCLLLAALTARSADECPEQAQHVRTAVLNWAAQVPSLPGSVGSFFGQLGPAALQELLDRLPEATPREALLAEAGYELHRSQARWAEAQQLAAPWPAPLRAALERGAAAHAARFPRADAQSG